MYPAITASIKLENWEHHDSILTTLFPFAQEEALQHLNGALEQQLWRKIPYGFAYRLPKQEAIKAEFYIRNPNDSAQILAKVAKQAAEFAHALAYQVMCDELSKGLTSEQLTKIAPKELQSTDHDLAADNHARLAVHWPEKIKLSPLGAQAIFNDVVWSIQELSRQLKINPGYLSCHLTLAVPTSHTPYLMAHTGVLSSAYDMLKATYPELKIVAISELKADEQSRALLVYADQTFGPAGYFALNQDPWLADIGYQNNATWCQVTLPSIHLVLTKPEQIVILEGI